MSYKERAATVLGGILGMRSKRKAAKADADIKAVRLARETRGVKVNPGTGAQAKDSSEKFGREVLNARARSSQLHADVKKRAKKKY